MGNNIFNLFYETGLYNMTLRQIAMVLIAALLMYLAIEKKYEPLLLIPISFGMLLANLPLTGLMEEGGLLYYIYQGVDLNIYPPLIFMGLGAMTDFGPLIANPKSVFLGAAAQIGVFAALAGAALLNFNLPEAASIAIIGGANGPAAIFLSTELAPHLLGAIAVAAYSYMALVPIIQPPIMRFLTSEADREIEMVQLREVNKKEKILFAFFTTLAGILIIPSSAALIGSLMFGNFMRESGVVERLADTTRNAMINIVTIFLGLTVGAISQAEVFLTAETIYIIILGLAAFIIGTISGLLFARLMNKIFKAKINPLIGSAGVAAVPMSARVSQKLGKEANDNNYLLMHAMGPNVAGLLGSAMAAGVLLSLVA